MASTSATATSRTSSRSSSTRAPRSSRAARSTTTRTTSRRRRCPVRSAHRKEVPVSARSVSTDSDLHFDPADPGINANPYPVYRRLREEAPLYYNAERDFYVLSRFDDVERGIVDHGTYSSAKGGILELIKADIEIP